MTIAKAVSVIEAEIPSSEYYTISIEYKRYGNQKPRITHTIYTEKRGHHAANTLLEALELFQASAPTAADEIEQYVENMKGLVAE